MAKKPFSRLIKILTGVYTGAEGELSRLERFAHLCVLVWKSFVRNRCLVRASALSYTTLLAFIPLLAVAISVTSSLLKTEGEQEIYGFIDRFVSNVMPPATVSTNGPAVAPEAAPGLSAVQEKIKMPEERQGIFRKQALERMSSPERLDQLIIDVLLGVR